MLSAKDAKLLQKNLPELVKSIDIQSSTLLAELRKRGALTQQHKEVIQAKAGNTNQVDQLLDILLRGDANTMDKFIYALRCSGHKHLVKTYLRDPHHEDEWDSEEQSKAQEAVTGEIFGPTAQELQQVLRSNIFDNIKNDPSRILEEAKSADYINQPLTAEIEKDRSSEKIPAENVFELLEHCSSVGQRVFIYGAGGMGKSSLCRYIANIWAGEESKLSKAFDYVFPIPMRAIRSHTLIEVICKDTKLIPESCSERIRQELDLKSALFILDSFEEMSLTTPEINKLIRRELYPKSSVLITARPDHGLEAEEKESTPCIKAVLQNLTEEQVKAYIISYPDLQEDDHLAIKKEFGMSFLCKPINLWLLCLLVARTAIKADIPKTQTVLLNMVTQRLMVAYSKKKNLSVRNLAPESPYRTQELSKIILTSESPMKNAPSEVQNILEKAGRLCYFGLVDKERVLTIDDGAVKADILAMGLFSKGADDNSVTLAHPLFQEYLAALFLSVDKRAQKDFLEELSLKEEVLHPLYDLLAPRGFHNMMRFLVGLSSDVIEGLSELFAIRIAVNINKAVITQIDLRYELDLLEECNVEEGRSAIAAALLKAPREKGFSFLYKSPDSRLYPLLLRYFDEEQGQLFLRKFYKCQICNNELIQATDSRNICLDSFGIGMIYLNNCTVRLGALRFITCHVPVSMLTDRLAAVEELILEESTLCDLTRSQVLAFLNLTSLSDSSTSMPLRQQEVLLTLVKLIQVEGLNLLSPPHCTIPTTRILQVIHCDDVNFGSLSNCFPGVCELVLFNTTLVPFAGQWSSVRTLILDHCPLDLISLKNVFVQLEELIVLSTVLTVKMRDLHRQTQWHTVKNLLLRGSSLFTDEGRLICEAREFLAHLCPKAEITIYGTSADCLPFEITDLSKVNFE